MEWKKICLLADCSGDTQRQLRAFARARFEGLFRRYRGNDRPSADANPWHLFESHLAVKNTRAGKRYKDWLFSRLRESRDTPIDVIQGGASLIMRDVVREFVRKECAPKAVLSIHKPLAGTGRGAVTWTLLDILAAEIDPVSDVCSREYERLAGEHALEFLATLSAREQAVLVAKRLGVSLAHPLVEQLADGRKSVLNATYHDFLARIARTMKARYPEEDQESVLVLALMTVQHISEEIFLKKRPEKAYKPLFMLTEEAFRETAENGNTVCA